MEAALAAANDTTSLASLAHWLKGAGGTVGFVEFGAPSLKLETAARESNLEDAVKHFNALKNPQSRVRLDAPTGV